MWNSGLDEAQAGIMIAGRNINSLRYADDTTLMAKSEEELKSLLMTVNGEGNGTPLQYCCLENPMDGGAWQAAVHGVSKSRTRDMTEWLHFHFSLSRIGEGNGNPLQCSCLENPRDGGAWWAAVYGVAQSQTRLKRLSSSSSSTPIIIHYSMLNSETHKFTG